MLAVLAENGKEADTAGLGLGPGSGFGLAPRVLCCRVLTLTLALTANPTLTLTPALTGNPFLTLIPTLDGHA